jgi:hypothetical protein
MNPSDQDQLSSEPQWIVSGPEEAPPLAIGDLVMAWALDRATDEPRYIGELRAHQGGKRCNCECLSCGLPLVAVNAGKRTFVIRPHFRHPEGAEKDSCAVLSARALALDALRGVDVIELPRRRQSRRVAGLSGQYYEAWVELPAERVRVLDFAFQDRVSGILTLDDGRRLRVELTGSLGPDSAHAASPLVPTIRLVVDDPSIAAMPPGEIRKRLQLLVEGATWCAHWADEELRREAEAAAREAARDALDWLEDSDDLPEGLNPEVRRETLLHRKAKEILEREKRIRLPDLTVELDAATDDGNVLSRSFSLLGRIVGLESVALEKSLGRIRPDVLANTVTAPGWPAGPVLVEVTVTNTINDERLERIRSHNLPTLEIDISRMGGVVTEAEFARLVVEEHAGKRWLHHPRLVEETARLERDLAAAVEDGNQAIRALLDRDERRRALRQVPADQWAAQYLDAVLDHATLRERREGDAGLRQAVERAFDRVLECAEGLAMHGYNEAQDRDLYGWRGNILERILSLKLDRAVGYQLSTAWQVINAILQEGPNHFQWHTLYLIAIRRYSPTLTPSQAERVAAWRNKVWRSIEDGERMYERSRKYDRLLGLLFPEMAGALAKPLADPRVSATRRNPEATVELLSGRTARQDGYVEVGYRNSRLRLPARDCEAWLTANPGWAVITD